MKRLPVMCLILLSGCKTVENVYNAIDAQATKVNNLFSSPAPAIAPVSVAPAAPNSGVYAPGVYENQSGQPVTYQPAFGGVPGETLTIKPNVYGPGVHEDQYGRPVYEQPWP